MEQALSKPIATITNIIAMGMAYQTRKLRKNCGKHLPKIFFLEKWTEIQLSTDQNEKKTSTEAYLAEPAEGWNGSAKGPNYVSNINAYKQRY